MQKRFIVLIDFSEYSDNLLKYAADWSRQVGAELLLVHKTEFAVSGRLSEQKIEGIRKRRISEGLEKLQELRRSVLPDTAYNVTYKVVPYHLTAALSKLSEEPYENTTFVGLKGTGLLKRLFLGSVAVKVIEKAKNLVVAAPKDVEGFPPEKLFVGLREEHPLNVQALKSLLRLFGEKAPAIIFFTVANPNKDIAEKEKYLAEVAKQFAPEINSTFSVYQGAHFTGQIKKMIGDRKKEVLVVQKGSRFLQDRLFRKFLINELIYNGKTPLIILP